MTNYISRLDKFFWSVAVVGLEGGSIIRLVFIYLYLHARCFVVIAREWVAASRLRSSPLSSLSSQSPALSEISISNSGKLNFSLLTRFQSSLTGFFSPECTSFSVSRRTFWKLLFFAFFFVPVCEIHVSHLHLVIKSGYQSLRFGFCLSNAERI